MLVTVFLPKLPHQEPTNPPDRIMLDILHLLTYY